MPKIIDNLREKLLLATAEQIKENGFSALTVRSVARACGVGVGTVYNYFPSKDVLVASFMLEDWLICLEGIDKRVEVSTDGEGIVRAIYDGIRSYCERHADIFSDSEALRIFSTTQSERHKLLVSQISKYIRPLCKEGRGIDADFLAEFIAESLLSYAVEGKEYERIYPILRLLMNENN